jgi:glucosamine-6-phosphate deaminase
VRVTPFDVRVVETIDQMADAAAEQARDAINRAVVARGSANVMFASGNSQLAFLDKLTSAGSGVDWSHVIGFHMDEYLGIAADHPASLRRYMREQILDRVTPAAFHGIEGDAPDPRGECERYAALLRANPLDLCCLGIGENGHLAFNDPPVADFDDPLDVKVVELDEPCRLQQVGEGHFTDLAEVPTDAITVTIPALLRAHRVLAIVPEARKREPVRRALEGPVSTDCPASILRTRDEVTLFLDRESAGGLAGVAG